MIHLSSAPFPLQSPLFHTLPQSPLLNTFSFIQPYLLCWPGSWSHHITCPSQFSCLHAANYHYLSGKRSNHIATKKVGWRNMSKNWRLQGSMVQRCRHIVPEKGCSSWNAWVPPKNGRYGSTRVYPSTLFCPWDQAWCRFSLQFNRSHIQ